jgi:hypothetical protein
MPVWGSALCRHFLSEYQLFPCSFLCLPKETNQRKGPLCPLSRHRRDALRSSMLPGLCKLATLKQCKSPFRQPLRCSAACQWDFTFPHLSCRASQTGAEKTRELSEGEARVFPRPALVEKQGKPVGPGLVGVPFSCFFFWARKRRKKTVRSSR